MRTFLLAMLGALTVIAPLTVTAGSSKPEVVLWVLVQNTEIADPTKVVQLPLDNPPEVVNFNKIPIVNQHYLWDLQVQPDGSVVMQFDATGASVLEAATRTNMGKIMAVLFQTSLDDGNRILLSAVIDRPLTNGRLRLQGMTVPEIKKVQAFIAKRRAD